MRFDFHNDKRLMQADTSTGNATIEAATAEGVKRRAQKYKQADTPEKAQAAYDEMIRYAREVGLLSAGTAAANELAKVAGSVEGKRATDTAGIGTKAAETDLQLQSQRGNTTLQTLMTEATTKFQAMMMVPNLKLQIYGFAQMIGEVFGSESLCNWAKEKMDALELPEMDTSKIDAFNTSITTRGAEGNINGSADRAQTGLRASPAQMNNVVDALIGQVNGVGPQGGPGNGALTQTQARSEIGDLIKEGTINRAQGQQIMTAWVAAGSKGGDKGTVDNAGELAAVSNFVDRLALSAAASVKVKQELQLKPAPVLASAGPAPTP